MYRVPPMAEVRENGNSGDLTYSHVGAGGLRVPPNTPLRPWPMRLLKFSELRPLTLSSDAALLSPQPKAGALRPF